MNHWRHFEANTGTGTGPSLEGLQAQMAELQSSNTLLQLRLAREEVLRAHPQLPAELLESFQGGPDEIRAFGAKLAEKWPAPAPQPAPLTQATPAPQPPAVVPGIPAPTAAAVPAVTASETTSVPTPSPADVLDQTGATQARAEDIRDKMTRGVATPDEARWLSQWGPQGFTAAFKGLGAQARARMS